MQEIDLIKGMTINYWLELGMAISLIGIGYIVGLIKKQFTHKKKSLTVSWSTHSQIHELLTELRVKVDCARAQIVQFHNGEYFMDGISMKKLSLTHESLSKGVSEEAGKTTNILISLFTPLMEKVLKDTVEIYRTSEDDNGICKHMMMANNTVAYAVLPLRHKNSVSGYIIIDWCSEIKAKRINLDEVVQFLTEARDYTQVYLKDILKEENL